MTMDTAGMVTHVWASTAWSSNSNGIADHLAYHDLRNSIEIFAAMDLQALKAVDLGGQTFLILACPGGRVRVLQPGAMTQGSVPHSLGSLVSSSDDFGTGGCALATKVNQTAGTVTIAVGTMYDHAPRNTYPAQPLQDNEVLAGAVRILTMNNNGQLTSPSVTIDLHPSAANPRGGYGVAGLLIDDLLPGTSYPGDELIVTTLSGDLFVYSLSGTLLFHTFVPGALGCTTRSSPRI